MFISYRYKFLFVHIAKTGGTSVRATLQRERFRDRYFVPLYLVSRLSAFTGHRLGIKFPRHAKIIAAQQMLPHELFDSFFKFAFVRNPWDLQVSSYHHIRRERPHLMTHIKDFDQFIKWKMDPDRPYQYHVDTSMELQSDYLVDLHGNLLTDFIGHYETLQADFDHICDKVGIPRRALPHKRKAIDRDSDYRSYYTPELVDLVAGWFKTDIEKLGYQFE